MYEPEDATCKISNPLLKANDDDSSRVSARIEEILAWACLNGFCVQRL